MQSLFCQPATVPARSLARNRGRALENPGSAAPLTALSCMTFEPLSWWSALTSALAKSSGLEQWGGHCSGQR